MKEKRENRVKELFLTFFKIGAFTFGGGYAMIPLIQKEVVENKSWMNDEELLEVVAIAESTPGPIAVNASTYVGYKVKGYFGALMATLGVVLPSFIIILVISYILNEFKDNMVVKYAFNGIRAGVLALMIKAVVSMYKQSPKGMIAYVIMIGALVLTAFTGCSAIIVLIMCAITGMVTYLINTERRVK